MHSFSAAAEKSRGIAASDATLRRIGEVLREFGRRPLDLAARYVGEEFALTINDVTVEHASKVAEQLREAVAGLGCRETRPGTQEGRNRVFVKGPETYSAYDTGGFRVNAKRVTG